MSDELWLAPKLASRREEETMSFRERARQRIQERGQPAQPGDAQDRQEAPSDAARTDAGGPADPASNQPEYVTELEQLAQLKDDGILTEDEYAAKKAQILGI
jgi:hypothetical protein